MIKKLSKNIFIYGGTNALKSLVPLLMLPILTKYLSPEELGILSIIETTILFLMPFVLLNINGAINVEFFKLSPKELSLYVSNALLLSLIAFIIVFLLSLQWKDFFGKLFDIPSNLVAWITLFAFLRVASMVVLGLFQVMQKASQFATFTILQTLIDFLLSLLFVVFFKWNYIGRLAGTYTSFMIATIIAIYLLYKLKYIFYPTLRYTKEILSFGLPLIPHALGGTTIAMADRYFLSYYYGNSYVALYTVAYQIAALMLLLGISVNQAWMPILFNYLKENKLQAIKKITIFLLFFFIFCTMIIYFIQNYLFEIFVDPRFYDAKIYFPFLLIGFMFQSFYFLFTNYIFYEKKTHILAFVTFSGAILNICLNFYFIKIFGALGVAYATAITWFLYFIVVLILSKKRKSII